MSKDWEDDYKARVLDPARRAGNALPQDLFARYGITGAHQDEAGFEARVRETVKYWNRLVNTKVYKPLAEALLTAHKELGTTNVLNLGDFTRLRDEARARAAQRLSGWIATVAAGIPCVTLATLAHFVQLGGGLLTDADVRKALADGGVKLIDPDWDVPSQAPVPAAAAVPRNLHMLGLRISPQVIFSAADFGAGFRLKDGFRLTGGSGSRLTADLMHEAKREQAKRPHDTRKTATETVLTTMLTADRMGALDRLVRWEAAEIVRSALGNGLPPMLAADGLIELGLDRGEALELAVTLAAGPGRGAGPEDDANALIAAELSAGRLRAAQAELAAAAAVDKDVRERVERLVATVDDTVAKADAAERAGRTEETARLLAEAAGLAGDDADLTARLARIPPPPPTEVVAGAGDDRVTVRWNPSAAVTGDIVYRLVRRRGTPAVSPDDGETVAETSANTLTDTGPSAATALHYTVFALRGTVASAGAAAAPVTLVPPIAGLTLTADGHTIKGDWRTDPAAAEVVVTRSRLDGAGPARRIGTRSGAVSGFVDPDVELGVGYSYRITVHYLSPDGERLESTPVVRHLVADHAPTAVSDLRVEIVAGARAPQLAMSWSAPAGGRVEIRRASAEPPWSAGDTVSPAEVDGYGEAVAATAEPDSSGRCSASAAAGQGRFLLTAVTRGSGVAVIGNTVAVELTAPVLGLRARRRGDDVHVVWIWPPDAHEARVEWSTGAAAGDRTFGRREVQDGGGVLLPLGPGPASISVRTVVRERHAELLSAPVVAEVAGRAPRVTWWLERTRLPRPRRTLVLSTDQACEIPELTLTVAGERSGPRVLIRIPGRWLPAGHPSTVDVTRTVPAPLIPSVCCEFAEPPGPLGVSLARRRG